MKAHEAGDVRVARIHTSNVRARRRLQALRIVLLEEEIVVAGRIGSQLGIIPRWTHANRAPLCQRPIIFAAKRFSSSGLDELAARYWRNAATLMQLAKDDVGAVLTQNLGPWHRGSSPRSFGSPRELAGLDGLLLGSIQECRSPSIAGWLIRPERGFIVGQCVTIQAPDGGDPSSSSYAVGRARVHAQAVPRRGERAQPDMDIGVPNGSSQFSGALSQHPRLAARAAIPSWNGSESCRASPAEHPAP